MNVIVPKYITTKAEKVYRSLISREPFLVAGMCESGKNLLYRETKRVLTEKSVEDSQIIFLDTVGMDLITGSFSITNCKNELISNLKISELTNWILEKYLNKNLSLLINCSDDSSRDDTVLFELVLNLRTSLGTNFVYGLYCYFDSINKIRTNPRLSQILLKNNIKLLPTTDDYFEEMVKRDEVLFGCKLTNIQKRYVFEMSGGNLGLIKTLIEQISQSPDWREPDLSDDRLEWRISRVSEGLSPKQIKILHSIASGQNPSEESEDYKLLEMYGYINDDKVFSKLLNDRLLTMTDDDGDHRKFLTATEYSIFNLLNENFGRLVEREQVAKLIWGEDWLKNYSDYALDRHISNIRSKLKSNKLPHTIQTLKGRGFIISSSKS